jgi:hypothetical protein
MIGAGVRLTTPPEAGPGIWGMALDLQGLLYLGDGGSRPFPTDLFVRWKEADVCEFNDIYWQRVCLA